jgi:DNA-binding NtrC family response regulator
MRIAPGTSKRLLQPGRLGARAARPLALVVEDDQFQRDVLVGALKRESMDVVQCESAETAELVVAKIGTELQLIVIDAWLAGECVGGELAAFAKEKFPHLMVVVVSGDEELPLPSYVRFLRKPYRPDDVLRVAMR